MNYLFLYEFLAPLILHGDCELCVALYVLFAWCLEAGVKLQVLCLSAGYELGVLREFKDFLTKSMLFLLLMLLLSLFQRWQETMHS